MYVNIMRTRGVIMQANKSVVLVFKQNGMGTSEHPDLPSLLVETLLSLLDDSGLSPAALCFYTDGVRLCCKGSNVLRLLRRIEAKRIPLILCGTCVKTLELEDKVEVGIIGGMTDILEAMWSADSVLYL
jgi:hypothetical protein